MTFPVHLILGLVIGKVTNNYPVAILASIAVDLDHLIPFARTGVLWRPKHLWFALTDHKERLGTPRYILHNVFFFFALCIGAFLVDRTLGLIVTLAYAGHLALDALDNTKYYPFYPNKSVDIRGPIKYFSKQEVAFAVVLLGAWLMI